MSSHSSTAALIGDTVNSNEQLTQIRSNGGFFLGEGKPEYPEKTSRCREENQQTQPTYDARSGNRTCATLVGGECSRLWLTVYLRTMNLMSMLNYSRNRSHYFSSMDFQHNKPIQNVKKKRFFKCSPNIPSGFVMMGKSHRKCSALLPKTRSSSEEFHEKTWF